MGFGREARRVRDTTLPHAYRLHALGSCIQLARPIGFHATWSYLEARLGLPWRSADFLVPALELLEDERAAHLRREAEYAAVRREQKRAGLRSPRRDEATPRHPVRWHGDERAGAFRALASRRGPWPRITLTTHPHSRVMQAAVDAVLGAPHPAALAPDDLQRALDWSRRQVHVVGWGADRTAYATGRDNLFLLGQLYMVVHGSPTIGSPWNFVTASLSPRPGDRQAPPNDQDSRSG